MKTINITQTNTINIPQDEHIQLFGDDIKLKRSKHFSAIRRRLPVVPIRYEIAFLTSLGFIISFGLRCNMGVSVIAMTHDQTEKLPNGTIQILKHAEFKWSPGIIGLVDSSFFWGYIVTQIPGGYLAAKYPANHVFGFALGISSFLNLFIPFLAKIHYSLVMFIRVIQGLFEGVTYPAAHGIWRWWAPPLERSTLATITFTGSYVGVLFGIPLSGMFTEYLNWRAAFYVFGAIGVLWSLYWWHVSYERPALHPRISPHERLYLKETIRENSSLPNKSVINPPWRSILKSMPVWSIIVANFCRSWSFYLLIDFQAKYFLEALNYNVGKDRFLAALPHLLMACIVPFAGKLADYLRLNYFSTTFVRKLMNCGGFGMEAFFLLIVAYVKTPQIAIVALSLAVGFSGFAIAGFNVNHFDLAPRYASILMGISNGMGTLAAISCPIVVEYLTPKGTSDEWSKIILLTAFIHIFGVIFYGIFASGELQPWAESSNDSYPCDDEQTNSTRWIGRRRYFWSWIRTKLSIE